MNEWMNQSIDQFNQSINQLKINQFINRIVHLSIDSWIKNMYVFDIKQLSNK